MDRDRSPLLIGICGRTATGTSCYSGKTTVATMLSFFLPNSKIMNLADPIKQIAMTLGFTEDQVNNPELKNVPHSYWGVTPRRLMQLIGVEMFKRNFNEQVWLLNLWRRILEHKGSKLDYVIISDVRSDDEAEFIISKNGRIVEVRRDINVNTIKHSTEEPVSARYIWRVIDNNGTIDDLFKNVKELADYIRKEVVL